MNIKKKLLFLLGILLFCINISGLFISLRNSAIYTEQDTYFENDINLTYNEALKLLERKKEETNLEFAQRVNTTIAHGIVHVWGYEYAYKYNLTVPIWENYLLYMAQFIMPNKYALYEFCNYDKALERGIGLCSQHTIIVSGILNKNHIKTDIINLGGHVVAQTLLNNSYYVFDPDYNIIIPHDIQYIERNTDIIKQYYQNISLKNSKKTNNVLNRLKTIYGSEDNVIYEGGIAQYQPRKYIIEKYSYYAKWIIPLLCMLPFLIVQVIKIQNDKLTSSQHKTI